MSVGFDRCGLGKTPALSVMTAPLKAAYAQIRRYISEPYLYILPTRKARIKNFRILYVLCSFVHIIRTSSMAAWFYSQCSDVTAHHVGLYVRDVHGIN